MSKFYITAEQAEYFSNTAKFASQQARSVGCMVEVDLENLQIFPTAPQFQAQIEVFENTEFSSSPISSRRKATG